MTNTNPTDDEIVTTMSAPSTLAYSMALAAELVGVSRSQLHEEAAAGRLATRKVGRRRVILAADLDAWLDALPVG